MTVFPVRYRALIQPQRISELGLRYAKGVSQFSDVNIVFHTAIMIYS